MDFQPEEILQKLKQNKLALPAIGVGVAVGLFLLYKNGSNSPANADVGAGFPTVGTTDQGTPVDNGAAGAGDSSALGDLQNQIADVANGQSGILDQVAGALSDLSSSLFGALNSQGEQFQSALNALQSPAVNDNYTPYGLDNANGYYPNIGDLFSQFVLNGITDFASASPDIFSDISDPSVSHFINPLAIANKVNLVTQKLNYKTPVTTQHLTVVVPSVQQQAHVVGKSVGNILSQTGDIFSHAVQGLQVQIRQQASAQQSISNPSIGHASNFSDIGALSGYKGASTAPHINPAQITANVIRRAGQGFIKPTAT